MAASKEIYLKLNSVVLCELTHGKGVPVSVYTRPVYERIVSRVEVLVN